MNAPTTGHTSATAEPNGPPTALDDRLRRHQLGLAASAIRDIAFTVPFWATVMTLMLGGAIPEIGNTPRNLTWPWIILCAVITAITFASWKAIKATVDKPRFNGQAATLMMALANFANAGAWSLVTLIFWQPENIANHSFLMVLTFGAVTLFLTSRSGSFLMVVAATAPIILMMWIHLLQQATFFDTVMASIIPFWAIQLHLDSWRACRSVTAAHRTGFEMEALASELTAARDEAAKASQAKSMFLANMSHELRTPLNAILGFSEIISTNALGNNAHERYRDYAGDVHRSGRHLLSLINDLLDVAKIESGKLELECVELDGDNLLQECIGMIADRAKEKHLTVRALVATHGLRVYADARAFRQIAINLLSNAVKFTPAGGSVEASLSSVRAGIELCIRDTGCGIPPTQLSRIFEPFEQVDNHYGRANGGTGLGLTLVRALSELHGGTCRIGSQEGRGTEVTIYLPLAKTTSSPSFASLKTAAG